MSSKIIPKGSSFAVRKVDLGELGSGAQMALRARGPAKPVQDPVEGGQPAHVRDQAYREGLDAGRREARAAIETERAELKALISGVNELMQDFEQTLSNDVLSMSLELAKQIVQQSLRVKPDLVLAVVREAISSLPGLSDQTILLLHPSDAALVRQAIESDPSLAALPWKIVEEPQLERGGCRLETPTTEVDASLETRWRRVVASLGRDDSWIDITI